MSSDTFYDIVWYEWLYSINNRWDIKNIRTSHILRRHKLKSWYYRVTLYKNWKQKHHLVHRLVAITLLKNPKNLPQINHIDWVKSNNNIDNLEWSTPWDNLKHAHKLWLKIPTKYWTWRTWKQNCNSKKVVQCWLDWGEIKIRDSMADVEREIWINRDKVSWCCSNPNRNKTAWWYKRKYFNN